MSTTTLCPDGHRPTGKPAHAREGRCSTCRPPHRHGNRRRPPAEARLNDSAI